VGSKLGYYTLLTLRALLFATSRRRRRGVSNCQNTEVNDDENLTRRRRGRVDVPTPLYRTHDCELSPHRHSWVGPKQQGYSVKVPRIKLIMQRTRKNDADQVTLRQHQRDVRGGKRRLHAINVPQEQAFEEISHEIEEKSPFACAPPSVREDKQADQVRKK